MVMIIVCVMRTHIGLMSGIAIRLHMRTLMSGVLVLMSTRGETFRSVESHEDQPEAIQRRHEHAQQNTPISVGSARDV